MIFHAIKTLYQYHFSASQSMCCWTALILSRYFYIFAWMDDQRSSLDFNNFSLDSSDLVLKYCQAIHIDACLYVLVMSTCLQSKSTRSNNYFLHLVLYLILVGVDTVIHLTFHLGNTKQQILCVSDRIKRCSYDSSLL